MEQGETATRVTTLVADSEQGGAPDPAATEELFRLLYDELRAIARRAMRGERDDHTLQPTALVHEAYLKLVDRNRVGWQGRSHFLAVSARAMRQVLIDHARGRGRKKRGGAQPRLELEEGALAGPGNALDPESVLDLDAALERLAAEDPRQARIVEMRLFGGLTVPEAAHVLGVSKRTVEGDWTHARAWLKRELARGSGA